MELLVAKQLIEKGISNLSSQQTWADLGSGEGIFTSALSELLPAKSKIMAIDKDARALKTISVKPGIELQTVTADLNSLPADLPKVDGVIMANALHYIKNQIGFLKDLKELYLKPSGILIVLEYDLEKSNPWVPYPVSKRKLAQLALESGFKKPNFLGSVESRLNSSEIYSALLKP